jgi:hypothetical protein
MESTAFFEKKICLSPKDLNRVKSSSLEDIILEKARVLLEEKCSEHGFVLPGSIKLISRSMGYFEPARFTGDVVYYVKTEGSVIYPADGVRVVCEVIRKNKMGLYVVYRDAIRIQIPRDLHIGNEEYEAVNIGDKVEVELKRSKFQVNDAYILASGVFIGVKSDNLGEPVKMLEKEGEEGEESGDDDSMPPLEKEGEGEEEESGDEEEEGLMNQPE